MGRSGEITRSEDQRFPRVWIFNFSITAWKSGLYSRVRRDEERGTRGGKEIMERGWVAPHSLLSSGTVCPLVTSSLSSFEGKDKILNSCSISCQFGCLTVGHREMLLLVSSHLSSLSSFTRFSLRFTHVVHSKKRW